MADVWLHLVDFKWTREKKERKADCFSLFSCYYIELETDHCSNAPAGVFFQLGVSISNNMNPNG